MDSILDKLDHKLNNDKTLRKLIRQEAHCTGTSYPIVLVDGDSPPQLVGRGFHWTNKRGDEIYHPNAYRRAWGKPIYQASDRRVEVGADWFLDLVMGLMKDN